MKDTRKLPSILDPSHKPADWSQRRAEILVMFRDIEFGTMPHEGYIVSFSEITPPLSVLDGLAALHQIDMILSVGADYYTVPFVLLEPLHTNCTSHPANLFMYAYENNAPGYPMDRIDIRNDFNTGYWPARFLLENGYVAGAFYTKDVESDNADAFPSGLIRFFNNHPETAGCTGRCIAAWAFAASHILDYFADCDYITQDQLSVTGHSRCGKAALWCGATDERVACTYANNSGCGGAALSRGTLGERIGQITAAFPHWLCERYTKYAGREIELPFDQHMLLGLIAPRLLYVTSGSEDAWNDPESEFLSCVYANEAYAQYGLKGLETRQFPTVGQPLHEGHIGYHVREGGHDLTMFDWALFIDFFDSHRKRTLAYWAH